ncbi:nucleoside 2-deoxyribosyltransferase [Thalassolituus sp. LLYu03]|uniref:nucleoside 2-deoxyribosyltransferase n=1 Tax=Thalassolituus sp. LLYu03 TaxID=3421656 RepID=UPI003D2E3FCF
MKRIYLAGPEVFLPNANELGLRKKQLCRDYGFEGLFPLDTEIRMGDDNENLGFVISRANEGLIHDADIIIANLTPFRGASADVGTVYELGLARGLGKILLGYSNDPTPFTQRTFALFGDGPLHLHNPGELHDRNGLKIEEFGLNDNLMIDGGIHAASGEFLLHDATDSQRFTDLTAFERLLAQLKARSF